MIGGKVNIFEVALLFVGVGTAIFGFNLINQAFKADNGTVSWMMILAIFSWLTLLVMFITLSLIVDLSKKELSEIKALMNLLSKREKKK